MKRFLTRFANDRSEWLNDTLLDECLATMASIKRLARGCPPIVRRIKRCFISWKFGCVDESGNADETALSERWDIKLFLLRVWRKRRWQALKEQDCFSENAGRLTILTPRLVGEMLTIQRYERDCRARLDRVLARPENMHKHKKMANQHARSLCVIHCTFMRSKYGKPSCYLLTVTAFITRSTTKNVGN